MSKKNKALKQLLKSQMQVNAAATVSGKDLSQQIHTPTTGQTMPVANQPIMLDKEVSEFVLIRKDIKFSVLLITIVLAILVVIYVADQANPFLLNLANKIFGLLQ